MNLTKLDLEQANDFMVNYLENHQDFANVSYHYVDSKSENVIVGLINNNEDEQKRFYL